MNFNTASLAGSAENPLPVERLLELLREGRDAVFDTHSKALLRRLGTALGVEVIPGATSGRTRLCAFGRPDVRLRGFGRPELAALILAEPDPGWVSLDHRFWGRVENPLDLPFIFACGDEEAAVAKSKVGGRFTMVWEPAEIVGLLAAARPLEYLKELLRARFGMGKLHPFDHHHPVTDASFIGRRDLLDRLRENPRTNFALVGPSKMGKTSLARRYLRAQAEDLGGRDRRFFIDLYAVPASEAALVRALRMGIDPSAAAYYDAAEHFVGFVEKVRSRLGGTLEIIVDEVDKHCGFEAMRRLMHLAQRGVCRLILIGRWRLMKEAVHSHDDNFLRLETVVMESLSLDESVELLEKPLADLGLRPNLVRHELRSVASRLGCVPGQLQEFGSHLVEELARAPGPLTNEIIRRALAKVITSSRLVGLLEDLSSTVARVAALLIAFEAPTNRPLDPTWLFEAFAARGFDVRVRECIETCNELVIHHLLGYEGGVYRMCRWDFIAKGEAERRTFAALLEDEMRQLA